MVSKEGMYRTVGDDMFKVQRSKQSGYLYAKHLRACEGTRLTETDERAQWEFVYSPGAINALTDEMALSVTEAMEFGIKYGVCCVCGARLKDAKSVRDGIGPICQKRAFTHGAVAVIEAIGTVMVDAASVAV